MKIEIDPFINARDIITLTLPVERHSGNWYVEKAVHTITDNGAITELSLNKNGVGATVKNHSEANKGKINTSTGEATAKDTNKVRYSGVNGLEANGGGILSLRK